MVFSLQVGCIVEGPFGDFEPIQTSPDGSKAHRRKRLRIKATITHAHSDRKWTIRLDTGKEKIVSTSQLKFISDPWFNSALISNENTATGTL